VAGELLSQVVDRPATWLALHYRVARAAWLSGIAPTEVASEHLWPAYRAFLDRHFGALPSPPRRERGPGPAQRIALVAPQLLNLQHAPTRVVFEYARVLRQVGGRDVLVVDAELMPQLSEAHVDEPFIANRNPRLPSEGVVTVDGTALPFHRPDIRPFCVEKVLSTLERVLRHRPDVVLSYGNWNAVGDVAARYVPTVHLPAARERAFSLADAFLFPARTPAEATPPGDGALLPGQRGRYVPYTFMPARFPAPAAPTPRASLGLEADDVVFAVVGNRLRDEIDEAFRDVVRAVLDASDRAVVAVVGDGSDAGLGSAVPVAHRNRVRGVPYQPDLRAFLGACDVFLDPFRRGGGTSGYLAMLEGLAVLSLGDGDLRNYLGATLVAGSLERYRADAVALAREPGRRRARAEAVAERAREIPLLEDAFDELDAIVEDARNHHHQLHRAA